MSQLNLTRLPLQQRRVSSEEAGTPQRTPKGDQIDVDELTSGKIFSQVIRPCIVEILGSAIYVFAVSSSALVLNYSVRIVAVAVSQGLSVLFLTSTFGHISGAHFNPSLTIGCWIGGGIGMFLAFLYLICQFFGAFMGAVFFKWIIERQSYNFVNGAMTLLNYDLVALGEATLLECLLTSVLVLTYLITAVDGGGERTATSMGGCMCVATLAGYRATGASMNPARSAASLAVQAIFIMAEEEQDNWARHQWIYWLGPTLGAVAAAALFRCLLASDRYRILFKRD